VIVVDTNVTAYLWLPGELTQAAERLLSEEADWAVPLLWRSEFRSVLAGAVKRKVCRLEQAVAIARAAEEQLTGREFAVETGEILRLAHESGCSAYDCEFVALARTLGVSLVSNDREVLKAFPAIAVPLEHYASRS
jgi:predicted nucleic acid-binding protein